MKFPCHIWHVVGSLSVKLKPSEWPCHSSLVSPKVRCHELVNCSHINLVNTADVERRCISSYLSKVWALTLWQRASLATHGNFIIIRHPFHVYYLRHSPIKIDKHTHIRIYTKRTEILLSKSSSTEFISIHTPLALAFTSILNRKVCDSAVLEFYGAGVKVTK